MTGTVAAAPKNAGKIAAQHNEILRAAYDRVDMSLERRLADVIQPILERAGQRAAAAFARRATHHLTAAALREADRDALLRTPFYDGPGGLGFRLRPNVLTASAPSPNATMVCVKPRPDEAAILTVPGGEPAETLHVTLAPLGETDGDLEEIRAALAAVAATHGPLDGVVGGVGRFQPPGVAILLPDVPGLVELRVAVTEALAGAQVDYARDHGFEAHISVDAAPDPATLEEALARTAQRPLHFDALLVVRGDEIVHELPLVGVLPITAAGGNPGWTAPAGDEILDVDSLVAEIRKKTDPVRTALVEAAMTPSLKAAGMSFDVTNPLTAKVLAQSGSQIRGIAETTQLNVMRIIGRAYGNGLSIPQTSALIRQGMADASRTRATTIARCLPGETLVSGAMVRAVTRRWYEGDMVVLLTEAGREFTATPNHPMLTASGWQPAGNVDVGQDLICYGGEQNTCAAGNEDVAGGPTSIAEIFEAAAAVGVVERRYGGEPDFHGDGRDGEVDIARPDGPLTVGRFAALYEHLREEVFAPSDVIDGPGFCAYCGHLLAVDKSRCLCGASSMDVRFAQDARDECAGYSEVCGDSLSRHSAAVAGDDVGHVDVFASRGGGAAVLEVVGASLTRGATLDTGCVEPIEDGALVNSNGVGDLRGAQAADVERDRVIAHRRVSFSGYVFNLVTPHGYFTVNGGYTGNTELAAAANGGSLAAAQLVSGSTDGPPLYKQWLCVAPWTRVAGAGVLAVVRKPYEGELVTISARPAGRLGDAAPALRSFTVTPDHLVLTRRGWVPAGLVDEGDEVVGGIFAEHDASGQPDVDDVQPTIAQVFDTASERLSAVGMMSVPVYLDGGRLGEKVDVVATNGCLMSDLDATLSEPLRELALTLSDVGFDELLRGCASSDGLLRHGGSESGGVPETALLSESVGVAEVAERVGLTLRSDPDTVRDEDATDGAFASTETARERLQRLAGLVRFDDVISVERREWAGHVYDLTTLSGWFFADGYVAHNTAPGAPHPRHEDYDGLDGQTVALDADFDVGGNAFQYPGDPDGAPEDAVNCRCALSYTEEPPEDAIGGSPGAGLDDGGFSTDGTAALDEVMPLTPPPGDDVSVMAGPFVPADYVARIKENGLDVPLPDLKPTTTLGRDVFAQAPTTEGLFKAGGHYLPDGTYTGGHWTQERTALHDQIIAGHFEGRAAPTLADGEKPTAVFTAGGSASGKGSSEIEIGGRSFPLKDLEDDAARIGTGLEHDALVARGDEWAIRGVPKYPDVILMNPDLIKEMLPEYERLKGANDLYAASGVHEESSEIGKTVARLAQEQGFNVVMDTTGASGSFVGKLEQAVKDGYDVKVRMVSAPTNEAIVRAIDRGDKTGRFVSIQALKNAHRGASAQLAIWQDNPLVTDWKLVDTRAGEANTLVAEGVGGKVTIYDQEKWDEIIAKANETSAVPGTTFGRQG